MRILLLRPWVNKNITTVKNFLFGEPLGIECVAGVLKEQGHRVLLVDFMIEENGKIEPYLRRFRPHAVGITSQCTDVVNVLDVAKRVRKYSKRVGIMVGGVQATCFPDCFFTEEVDYVFRSTTRENICQVTGEIQERWQRILQKKPEDYFNSSKAPMKEEEKSFAPPIRGVYSKALGFVNQGDFCLNEYLVADREITARYRKRYQYVGFQPCAIIQTAYGCRNRCRFCVRWKLEGPQLRELPAKEVVKQIGELKEPYVMICDNDFLIHEKRLEEICDLLEAQNIQKKYICYGSVNSILEKPQVLMRLAKNGLMAVIVGYEAFDDRRLEEYNKAATVDENAKATVLLQKYQIACWGSFILHPDWEKKDFNRLLSYIDELKPELITFSPLVPHPLTPLYEEYKDRLIYDVTQYEKWNFGDVLIYPSGMSLRQYYWQVLKLAMKVNLNSRAVAYTRKHIPLKNSLKMVFGFRTLLGVYVKNMLLGHDRRRP